MASDLSIVPDPDPDRGRESDADVVRLRSGSIPDFEGAPVDFSKARLTSVSGLEIDDEVLRMDQILRLQVEGRVTRVDHVVNERSGKLERVQTIKVIDATIVPWDD